MRSLTLVAAIAGCAVAAPAFAQNATASATLTVSATVPESCAIADGGDQLAIDFGNISTTAEVTSTAETLNFTCSLGTTYMVSAGSGLYADGAQRRLRGTTDTTAMLDYTLLSGTTGTDPFVNDTVTQTSDGSAQSIAFRVQLPAAATGTQRAADVYSDTVQFTITY